MDFPPHETLDWPADARPREALVRAFGGVLSHASWAAHELYPRDPVEGVRAYRKALRRARALLDLTRALAPQASSALNTQLRDLGREVSAQRDADVLIKTLDKLPDALHPREQDARDAWRALLTRDQATHEADLTMTLRHGAACLAPMPYDLIEALPRPVTTPALERQLRRAYKRTRRARQQALPGAPHDHTHDWRKRAKTLRHLLEFLHPKHEDHQAMARVVSALGEVTDRMVLHDHIVALDSATLGVKTGKLRRHVESLITQGIEACQIESAALFEPSPDAFEARHQLPRYHATSPEEE